MQVTYDKMMVKAKTLYMTTTPLLDVVIICNLQKNNVYYKILLLLLIIMYGQPATVHSPVV